MLVYRRVLPVLQTKEYLQDHQRNQEGQGWFFCNGSSGYTKPRRSPTDAVTTLFYGVAPVGFETTCAPCVSKSPTWSPPIGTTMRASPFLLVMHQWCKMCPTCQVTISMTEGFQHSREQQHFFFFFGVKRSTPCHYSKMTYVYLCSD